MRIELKKAEGDRIRFRAVVERYGTKTNYHGYPEQTILFRYVTFADSGVLATDHIWFTVGKTIRMLDLIPGDVVEFDARIGAYTKGYFNPRQGIFDRETDYKLNRPTKFSRINAVCTN